MNRRLIALLGIGLAVRLALLPVGAYGYDLTLMQSWAERLVTRPLVRFYASPEVVDHLPGDLWLLWLLGRAMDLIAPGALVPQIALKLVPTLADVGIGVFLFLLGRRLAGPDAGLLAAALFVLNPASIFLTAIWGQWDSVSAALALIAVWLVVRGDPAWALPPLAWAALIKPPFAALVPLVFLLRVASRRAAYALGWHATHDGVPRGITGEACPDRGDQRPAGGGAAASLDVGVGVLRPGGISWSGCATASSSTRRHPSTRSISGRHRWSGTGVGRAAAPRRGRPHLGAGPVRSCVRPDPGPVLATSGCAGVHLGRIRDRVRRLHAPDACPRTLSVAGADPRGPGCRAGASAALVLRGAVSVLFHKPLLGLRSERAGTRIEVLYQSEAVVVLVSLVNVGLLAYTLTRMLPVLRDSNAGTILNESPPIP